MALSLETACIGSDYIRLHGVIGQNTAIQIRASLYTSAVVYRVKYLYRSSKLLLNPSKCLLH